MRIEARGLSVRFGDAIVLDGIDFADDASSLAVIGPSGGGKSTLLRILGGLLAPTEGEVLVNGERVPRGGATLDRYRRSVGFVFQDGGLFQHLSVRENIALPLRAVHGMSRGDADRCADELLARFGLSSQADTHPALLSGGQRQRAAIARAVAPGPGLLLLDEPTSALDPEYTAEVLDLLDALRAEGTEFVMVTHEMGFARYACEKVAFLHGGRIAECGRSEDVFGSPSSPQLRGFLDKMLEWRV